MKNFILCLLGGLLVSLAFTQNPAPVSLEEKVKPSIIVAGRTAILTYEIHTTLDSPLTYSLPLPEGLSQIVGFQGSCPRIDDQKTVVLSQTGCLLKFQFSQAIQGSLKVCLVNQPAWCAAVNIEIPTGKDADMPITLEVKPAAGSPEILLYPGQTLHSAATITNHSTVYGGNHILAFLEAIPGAQLKTNCDDNLAPSNSCQLVELSLASDTLPGSQSVLKIEGANTHSNTDLRVRVPGYQDFKLLTPEGSDLPLPFILSPGETGVIKIKNNNPPESGYQIKSIAFDHPPSQISHIDTQACQSLAPQSSCQISFQAESPLATTSLHLISDKTGEATFPFIISSYPKLSLLATDGSSVTAVNLAKESAYTFFVQNNSSFLSTGPLQIQGLPKEVQAQWDPACQNSLAPRKKCQIKLAASASAESTQTPLPIQIKATQAGTAAFDLTISQFAPLSLLNDEGTAPLSTPLAFSPGETKAFRVKNNNTDSTLTVTNLAVAPLPSQITADLRDCQMGIGAQKTCRVVLAASNEAEKILSPYSLHLTGNQAAPTTLLILINPLMLGISPDTIEPMAGTSEILTLKNDSSSGGIAKNLLLDFSQFHTSTTDFTTFFDVNSSCQMSQPSSSTLSIASIASQAQCQLTFQAKPNSPSFSPKIVTITGNNIADTHFNLGVNGQNLRVNWADQSQQHLQYKLIEIKNATNTQRITLTDLHSTLNTPLTETTTVCEESDKACYSDPNTQACSLKTVLNPRESCFVGLALKAGTALSSLTTQHGSLHLELSYDLNGIQETLTKDFNLQYNVSLYIGGSFKNNLLRWTGSQFLTLEGASQNPDGAIYSLLSTQGDLYAAGHTTFNGHVAVFRWNGEEWSPLSLPDTEGDLNSLVFDARQDTLLVAENGGTTANQLLGYSFPEGQWYPYGEEITSGPLFTLLPDLRSGSNVIYIGGGFHQRSVYHPGFIFNAMVQTSHRTFQPFSADYSGLTGSVESLADYKGQLYLGGLIGRAMDTAGNPTGQYFFNIAKWDGKNFQPLGTKIAPGVDGEVLTLATSADGSLLYLGGNFLNTSDKQSLNCLAQWDGTQFSRVLSQNLKDCQQDAIRTLASLPDSLYVGGAFMQDTAGNPYQHLVRIDLKNHNALVKLTGDEILQQGVVYTLMIVPALLKETH